MTLDERIEFLMQSIESHDRQIGELVEWDGKQAERIKALDARLDRFIEMTQLNFDRLTSAMMGLTEHTADHQHRIEKLERRPEN